MTKDQRRVCLKLAAAAARTGIVPAMAARCVRYYAHEVQHAGLDAAAAEGPAAWAREVGRIVAADADGATPAKIEEARC